MDCKKGKITDSPKKLKSSKSHSSKKRVELPSVKDNNFITFYPVPTTNHSTADLKDSVEPTMQKKRKLPPTVEPLSKKGRHDNPSKNSSEKSSQSERGKIFSNKEIMDVCRCDQCDFISIEMSDLIEHKQEVHALNGKPVILAPCDYNPAVHNDIEYKCTLCGLSDFQLSVIRHHITKQHGGKLETCERVTHRKGANGFKLLVESVKVYR